MHKQQIELSIIVPCYNEEQNIRGCIEKIPKFPYATEIIVVDGGSSDNTFDVARAIKKQGLRVLRYTPSRSKGYACAYGIDRAEGNVIIIQDVDMAPEDIPKIVEPIIQKKADFVNTTRLTLPMEVGAMSGLNKFGNKIFALLVSIVLQQKLTDTLSGQKAFRTELLRGKLKEDNWPDFEMLIKAKRNNAKIIEIPIRYIARKFGEPKMKPLSHGYSMLKMLLKLALNW